MSVNNQDLESKNIIIQLRLGNKLPLRDFYLGQKSEFVGVFCEKYAINSFQAGDLYKKSFLSLEKAILQDQLMDNITGLKETLFTIADIIMTEDDVSGNDGLNIGKLNKTVREEVTEIENIPEKLIKVQKNLGDDYKKLVILSYYNKFPDNQVASIMGINLEELARRKEECLNRIKTLLMQE